MIDLAITCVIGLGIALFSLFIGYLIISFITELDPDNIVGLIIGWFGGILAALGLIAVVGFLITLFVVAFVSILLLI